jgi:hypothetical protein
MRLVLVGERYAGRYAKPRSIDPDAPSHPPGERGAARGGDIRVVPSSIEVVSISVPFPFDRYNMVDGERPP